MNRDDQPTPRAIAATAAALVLLHLATRLIHQLALDPFGDESWFLVWVQTMIDDPSRLFVSFEASNKKPLFAWLAVPFRLILSDPYSASRTAAAFCGAGTALLLFHAGNRWYRWPAGPVAALFWIVSPFAVLHERIGLYEALTTLECLAVFHCTLHAFESGSRKAGVLLGVVLGVSWMTKSYALAWGVVPILAWAISPFGKEERPPARILFVPFAVGAAIFFAGHAIPLMRFGRGLFISADYFVTGGAAARAWWELWAGNAAKIGTWFWTYLGFGTLAAVLFAFGSGIKRRDRVAPLPVIVAAVLIGTMLLFGKSIHSRYALPAVPLLVLAASERIGAWSRAIYGRIRAGNRTAVTAAIGFAFVVVATLPVLPHSIEIVAAPHKARMAPGDRFQYVEGWPAGTGVREMADAIAEIAEAGPVDLFTTPFVGTEGAPLRVLLQGNENVRFHTAWWFNEKPLLFFAKEGGAISTRRDHLSRDPDELSADTLGRVLFTMNAPLVRLNDLVALNPNARLVWQKWKPGQKSYLAVLEIPIPRTGGKEAGQ